MQFKGTLPATTKSITPAKPRDAFDNGHWQFSEQMGGPGFVGFVYIVYDKVLNRGYIGKKQFLGMGQANKGKDSGWRKYKTSSKTMAAHFKERPLHEFEFICVEQYKTKGTLSYSETWSLCFVEAPTSEKFYNTLIEKVSWPVKERITDRHKLRMVELLNRIAAAEG